MQFVKKYVRLEGTQLKIFEVRQIMCRTDITSDVHVQTGGAKQLEGSFDLHRMRPWHQSPRSSGVSGAAVNSPMVTMNLPPTVYV